MNTKHFEYLTQLRQELESISASPWSNIERWVAKTTPLIKTRYSEFFEQFLELTKVPPYAPVFVAATQTGY